MKNRFTLFLFLLSTLASAQWQAFSTFYSYYYFSSDFIGQDTIFIVGFDNTNGTGKIVNTLDGTTWSDQVLPANTPQLFAVKFVTKNIGFAAGQNGTILKTTNLGLNWFNLNSGTTQQLTGLWFIDKDTGYACGSNGTILKTTNSGASWNSLATNTGMIVHSICFPTTKIGYAVAYSNPLTSGTILKSTDYGNSWAAQNSPQFGSLTIRGQKVLFLNKDTGYVVGLSGAILKTYNGGIIWTQVGVGQTIYNLNNIAITPTANVILCGGQGTILKSTDFCNTITDGGSVATTIDYETVNMLNDSLGYMFGTNGGALRTISVFSFIEESFKTTSATIFPNPTSNILNIVCKKNISEISIINADGKNIFTEKFSTNTFSAKINLSQVKSGTYFLSIMYGGKIEIKKILIQ